MRTLAAEQMVAVPSTVIVLVVGAAIFSFGFAMAVVKRANRDYKALKAGVKLARSGFWGAWRRAALRALLVGVFGLGLFVWAGREIHNNNGDADKTPVPATVATPTPSPTKHAHR